MPAIDIPQSVLDWIGRGERGLSSESMVEHLYGLPLRDGVWRRHGLDYPSDPADLRRCLLLLQASPETRARLPEMATASRVWKRLVDRWSELERLFLEEAGPNGLHGLHWSAPRTYAAMRQAIEQADTSSAPQEPK